MPRPFPLRQDLLSQLEGSKWYPHLWHLQLNALPPSFDPLEHAVLRWLPVQSVFLLIIASTKWVCELHAPSVARPCWQWYPNELGVTMWPDPAFLPEKLSAFHVNWSINLAAYKSQGRRNYLRMLP